MQTADSKLEAFYSIAVEEGLIKDQDLLCERYYLTALFDGIKLNGARVLDIGGGSGEFSFYAACLGAAEVVCLEPEIGGSASGVNKQFENILTRLPLDDGQVVLETVAFQSFQPGETKFDVILLHNSINHLDESACKRLLESEVSKNVYLEIFSRLYAMSKTGAQILVCDCSRYNFFPLLHIRNPFAPTIDWRLHQAPQVWSQLLKEVGFADPVVRWTTFRRLSRRSETLNRLLFKIMLLLKDKAFISYFLNSHFCLRMTK